jgi:hypothetical protein
MGSIRNGLRKPLVVTQEAQLDQAAKGFLGFIPAHHAITSPSRMLRH